MCDVTEQSTDTRRQSILLETRQRHAVRGTQKGLQRAARAAVLRETLTLRSTSAFKDYDYEYEYERLLTRNISHHSAPDARDECSSPEITTG